jgi:hypothetical protein
MNKYIIYKNTDDITPVLLKTKGVVIWDKGIVYGVVKPKQK